MVEREFDIWRVIKLSGQPARIIPVARQLARTYGFTEPYTEAEARILISLINEYVDQHTLKTPYGEYKV